MKKLIKIQFVEDENNISIANTEIVDDAGTIDLIEITVGRWTDGYGGSDGISMLMNSSEFKEFIDECCTLLEYVNSLEGE